MVSKEPLWVTLVIMVAFIVLGKQCSKPVLVLGH